MHPAISRQLLARALIVSTSFCCRAVNGPPGVARALQVLAQRIRPFKDGNHTPSPPPHLLDKLTDELLVVASDVVAAVAAEGTALSGKQQYRLLACVPSAAWTSLKGTGKGQDVNPESLRRLS